jgi:hypothetical protein
MISGRRRTGRLRGWFSSTAPNAHRHFLSAIGSNKPDNLSDPDVLAQEIVKDLEAALELFRQIAVDLGGDRVNPKEI